MVAPAKRIQFLSPPPQIGLPWLGKVATIKMHIILGIIFLLENIMMKIDKRILLNWQKLLSNFV